MFTVPTRYRHFESFARRKRVWRTKTAERDQDR